MGLVSTIPAMQPVYQLIRRVSRYIFPVLILGESGTGKNLVAHSIHNMGIRRQQPFIPLDCAALVPTLMESELFGYVSGAFTGAQGSRHGLLESANGGTVFLDEIGELTASAQAKLLRFVQERVIRPIGSNKRVSLDVRVIGATNRDLESDVRAGVFRHDLYFRLNVIQIKLPPLRERKNDIPHFVDLFLSRCRAEGATPSSVSKSAMDLLIAYQWPGNVRELENAILHASAMCDGATIEANDLPFGILQASREVSSATDAPGTLKDLEHEAILRALHNTNGDKIAAARVLHIGKTTLYRKLHEYKGTEH